MLYPAELRAPTGIIPITRQLGWRTGFDQQPCRFPYSKLKNSMDAAVEEYSEAMEETLLLCAFVILAVGQRFRQRSPPWSSALTHWNERKGIPGRM